MSDAAGPARGPGGWWVAVVVPARDEAATVGATLVPVRHALLRARRCWRQATVVLVADRCRDATVARAAALGSWGSVVRSSAGAVGERRYVTDLVVTTSARRRGRAPGGFAADLRRLA